MLESILDALQGAIQQFKEDPWWELVCFVGEAIFGGRFVLQWIVSEYKKQSHIPIAFWYMSVVGTVIMFVYSVHIQKPVLILAFAAQIGIYVRNLVLIYRHNNKSPDSSPA
jgi:lipid-A-disaccharide synthase-like uncharacterized protein